jgi:hypothetical protein
MPDCSIECLCTAASVLALAAAATAVAAGRWTLPVVLPLAQVPPPPVLPLQTAPAAALEVLRGLAVEGVTVPGSSGRASLALPGLFMAQAGPATANQQRLSVTCHLF